MDRRHHERKDAMSRRIRLTLLAAVAAAALAVPAGAEAARFVGTVGPGFTITLKRPGSAVTVARIRAGVHTFVIHDNSPNHNFVLKRGTRILRHTTVPFTGTVTWRVRIRARRTYVYFCRPHASSMRGSFRGIRAA